MAKKTDTNEDLRSLKKALQEGKAILGTERVEKALNAKTLAGVYLAKNCPADVEESLRHYASLANIPVVSLELDNEELGVFCKKNFFVAVAGIMQ